ncbi:hypothetical protein BST61_g2665 [Cercospora zeina]
MAELSDTAIDDRNQQTPDKVDALNLTDLPPEMVGRIAEQADDASLRSLRLTCRDIATIMFPAYCEANFASRTITLSDRQSVSEAGRAAEHRVFGRYLTKLTFVIDEMYVMEPHLPAESCALCDSTRKPYSDRSRNRGLRLLFQHLSESSKPVEIEFVDSAHVPPGRCSILDRYRLSCSRVSLVSPEMLGRDPVALVLGAARMSEVKIFRLSVLAIDWAVCLYSSFIYRSRVKGLSFALQHMHQLEVHIDAGPHLDRESGVTMAFFDMMCSAPKLESLKLRLKEGRAGIRHVFPGLLFERQLPQLKNIHLDCASLHMSDLQCFVSHNHTLQKVNLTRVDFVRGSFSDDLLGDFHMEDAKDIHGPVRKLIGLPGNYKDLWSDDVALMGF